MSRYNARTKDGKEMAFGYDYPLCEYFVQVYDENDDLIVDLNSSGASMVKGQGQPVRNVDIHLYLMQNMEAKDWLKHNELCNKILLDLPI
jgi:hypothetical protein